MRIRRIAHELAQVVHLITAVTFWIVAKIDGNTADRLACQCYGHKTSTDHEGCVRCGSAVDSTDCRPIASVAVATGLVLVTVAWAITTVHTVIWVRQPPPTWLIWLSLAGGISFTVGAIAAVR